MSQHRHVLPTNYAIKMTGFCCNICGPRHKESHNTTTPQALFILYIFFERNLRGGSPISLSLPLVSVVTPNCGRVRDGLCSTCSNRLKISSNPLNSKSAWKNLEKKENHECEQEIMLNYKQHGRKKRLCAGERSDTNSSHSGQEIAPATQHKQNDTDSRAGDLSH